MSQTKLQLNRQMRFYFVYVCTCTKIFALTVLEERKWKKIPASRRELILRRLQKKSQSVRGSIYLETY